MNSWVGDFCQNFSLSRCRDDDCQEVSGEQLAAAMLTLQEMGCANINLVTPSHVMPQVLAALPEAVAAGLSLPLVYNCGGYESVEALRLLDGIVDVYLPDAKFLRRESAIAHAGAADRTFAPALRMSSSVASSGCAASTSLSR